MSVSRTTLQIGLIGAGWIGSTIAQAIDCGKVKARLVAVSDVNPESAYRLVETLQFKPTIIGIAELIDITDLVIEAAGPASLASIVPARDGCPNVGQLRFRGTLARRHGAQPLDVLVHC